MSTVILCFWQDFYSKIPRLSLICRSFTFLLFEPAARNALCLHRDFRRPIVLMAGPTTGTRTKQTHANSRYCSAGLLLIKTNKLLFCSHLSPVLVNSKIALLNGVQWHLRNNQYFSENTFQVRYSPVAYAPNISSKVHFWAFKNRGLSYWCQEPFPRGRIRAGSFRLRPFQSMRLLCCLTNILTHNLILFLSIIHLA